MHAEDVDVGVFRDAFLDVGVEFQGQFFAFFCDLGHVHHFGALGFRHREKLLCVIWELRAGEERVVSEGLDFFNRAVGAKKTEDLPRSHPPSGIG